MNIFYKSLIFIITFLFIASSQNIKRGREEGTSSIPASNVMGNGNITAFGCGVASYSLDGFVPFGAFGMRVGITDILQISGKFIPLIRGNMGPIDIHLQITTPFNDKLRFFGFALVGGLYLSTVQDTLRRTTTKDKPEYNSYPYGAFVADIDWLALIKWLPFKTYFKIDLVDNPDLLYRYDQLATLAAIEWKTIKHSLFINAGGSFYKEKATKYYAGDKWYEQRYFWIEPGGRYRFLSRFSILGSFKITLSRFLKSKNSLNPELFNIRIALEVPLYIKETNTEAIRTLIFLEQKKEKSSEQIKEASIIDTTQKFIGSMNNLVVPEDTIASFDYVSQRDELIKRREETQKKMEEIEQLFFEIDMSDSLKSINETPPVSKPDSTRKN
jgi:hypothetical protein